MSMFPSGTSGDSSARSNAGPSSNRSINYLNSGMDSLGLDRLASLAGMSRFNGGTEFQPETRVNTLVAASPSNFNAAKIIPIVLLVGVAAFLIYRKG